VLAEVPTSAPAYAEEIFGPVAPVVSFDSVDEAVELAAGTGGRLGGPRANLEAFTETQWVTVRGDLPAYPF